MGSYSGWVGETFRIIEPRDPIMVGLEGIVEPRNPIMVGVGETFRIMELWDPTTDGLERSLGPQNHAILQWLGWKGS